MNFSFGSNAPAAGQSTFGSSSFGAPSLSSFSFGATNTTTSAPTFGFGAAPAATATAPNFGFGSTSSAAPAFGFGQNTASSTASAFGFGRPATTSSGFSFGSTAPVATTTASGFGQFNFKPATTTSTGFGFGGFGGTTTTSAPSMFSGFNTATTSSLFPSFGASTTSAPSLFGGFGTTPSASGFSGFGVKQTVQAPVQQSAADAQCEKTESEYRSVYNCLLFGDDRDTIMAKFNLLQAYCGTGRGYYAHSKPPIDYTSDNYFCRFKSYAYSLVPVGENNEGLVDLIFNKKEEDILPQKNQIFASLTVIFGDRPTISVIFKAKRKLSESKCVITIAVIEKTAAGTIRKFPANEISSYLNQGNPKQQLANLGVEAIIARQKITEDQISAYLSNVPVGMNGLMWKKAIDENPNSKQCVPVPIIGYEDLKLRKRQQEIEIDHQKFKVAELVSNIAAFKDKQMGMEAKLTDLKRTHISLQHRALKVICNYDIVQKGALALQLDEEELKLHLENLKNKLNGNQMKNRFDTLLSQAKMTSYNYQKVNSGCNADKNICKMNENAEIEIMSLLKEQKDAISKLVKVIHQDFDDLKIMESSLIQMAQSRNLGSNVSH